MDASGPSCIIGVDKPQTLTSHDVVNRVRSVFGLRRVGHAGTLDPMATGVLVVATGPATRLTNYLVDQDKRYQVRIVFGAATDTDDGEGQVIHEAAPAIELADPDFADETLGHLVGRISQLPPVYSAIKQGGKRSYAEARVGRVLDLKPRDVELYEARLLAIGSVKALSQSRSDDTTEAMLSATTCLPKALAQREDLIYWDVELSVSKGTYIRSIARDLGQTLGCYGFVGALRRTEAAPLGVEECVSLEALADLKERAALDPLPLLGMRYGFVDGSAAETVNHGGFLAAESLTLYEGYGDVRRAIGGCVPSLRESDRPVAPDESIALVADDRLIAIAAYDEQRAVFRPRCVLTGGVIRGRAV